ncbi:MAG: zinc-dependent metalloprotease [Pseudoflavonifractor sp.]|nr:zinc-dependent metalloprotease [Pseudoflavonifractor sp.]
MSTRSHFYLLLFLIFTFLTPSHADAKFLFFGKDNTAKEITQEKKDSAEFEKSLANAKVYKGLFTAYLNKKGDLMLEIPDSAFNGTYMLVNRIKSVSETGDFVAGQMVTDPILIRLSKDDTKVFMHLLQTRHEVRPDDPIKASFDRNLIDPVVKGFKIKEHRDGSVVIDVTNFFVGDEKLISPIKDSDPLAKMLSGRAGIEGSHYSDGSAITNIKSFPENILIESRLAYTTPRVNKPYTVVISRSIVRLPDDSMPVRLQDNRVGYFSENKYRYDSSVDRSDSYDIIDRFRIEPSEADRAAYFSGQLVEPRKKIVFYVDSAFPDRLRGAVKEGILYWNKAFEAAGFKNVIEARDYPKNDPDFDPDDLRFSCFRYCVTPTANAMGPSYVDPRTGEILAADVIWYHNVLSLLHDWRFVQTAAVDPRVRTKVFDDSLMYESVTYAAAHEIGHCLGLMHNMGASYAYPVDSLRDPAFTQKYGTTPSIMDYARNNYVAQPGDLERGVKLTPPSIGVYDIHAINWGYRLIDGAKTPQDEKPILDKWIREKDGDPMYEFGAQQVLGTMDPTDQTEDIGDDHIKAGDLAISNLKIIMDNLQPWAGEQGENYERLEATYKALLSQYLRHLGHVLPYIGGVKFKEIRQGHNDGDARVYLSAKEQKRAMDWLLGQARTNSWLLPEDLLANFESVDYKWYDKIQQYIAGCLLSPVNMYRIKRGYAQNPADNYSLEAYIDDAIKGLFQPTYDGKPLSDADRTLQTAALDLIIKQSGLRPAPAADAAALAADKEFDNFLSSLSAPAIPCSGDRCVSDAATDGDRHFFRIVFGEPAIPAIDLKAMMTDKLQEIQKLYTSRRNTADRATRNYYNYQIRSIDRILNP